MSTLLLTLLLVRPAADIDLTAASAVLARQDGEFVRARFTVGAPAWTSGEMTGLSVGARPDGHERFVCVPRCNANEGDTVTVEGTLRVRYHPSTTIRGVAFPAWSEVSIRHGRIVAE